MIDDPEINEIIKTISKTIDKSSGCIDIAEFTKKDWEALKQCNLRSDGRVSYGLRNEKNPRGTVLIWSNGRKSWYPGKVTKTGETVELDANMMVCPISSERARRIACYIKELPLYYGSFEAKERGEVSSREALDIFLEGHGVSELLDMLPPDERESARKKIENEGWRWFFK